MLKENQINSITYTNAKGESSEREVIPMRIPLDSALTIDVSGMDAEDASVLLQYVEEYNGYYNQQINNMFNFENFIEQTFGEPSKQLKWRRLALDGIVTRG